jgi:CubicO group peptidase (beta-lactamase class C family)
MKRKVGRIVLGMALLLLAAGQVMAHPAPTLNEGAHCAPDASSTDLSAQTAAFEQILEDLRLLLKIPGMSAAIVKDQEVVWAEGFGYADLETMREATPDTPYELASLTKPFASTVLLQLVEQGEVDLDDPISKYGIRLKSPDEIRVRHLLSHTSEGVPGSYFSYHGYRYGHLTRVIDQASGQSFGTLLMENIVEPLAMVDSVPIVRLDEPEYDHIAAKLTKPYQLDQDLQVVSGIYEDHFATSVGLVSTVLDVAKYDIALDKNLLIGPETKEVAFTPTALASGEPAPYGLGWFVQDFQGTRLIWHYGNNPPSFSTLVLKVPEHGLTLIVFANTANLSAPFPLGLGDVMYSPAAVAFYKLFVLDLDPSLDIAWDADVDDVVAQLEATQDAGYGEIFKRELFSRYRIHDYFNQSALADRSIEAYMGAYADVEPGELKDRPLIAKIEGVGNGAYAIVEFTLERDTLVQVEGTGEQIAGRFWDYGGLEDVSAGELIWTMTPEQTVAAGGDPLNRQVSSSIQLDAGTYRLHYRTDGGHSAGGWVLLPPDGFFWGIALYGTGDSQTTVTTRTVVPTAEEKLLEQIHEPVVSTFEYAVLWSCIGIFLSAIVLWPVSSIIRRFARRKQRPSDVSRSASRRMRLARWVAGINGLLGILYTVVLMIFGVEFMVLHSVTSASNLSFWERSLLGIPYLSILLTVVQLVFAGLAWRARSWSWLVRIHYSVVTAAAIGYLLLLNYWYLVVSLF